MNHSTLSGQHQPLVFNGNERITSYIPGEGSSASKWIKLSDWNRKFSRMVPLIIIVGESNSGGYALNSELSSSELLARPAVQILNNNTLVFEDLQIGVNNLIGHSGLSNGPTHGMESGLANSIESGLNWGVDQIHLVKTGQGGSQVSQWGRFRHLHDYFQVKSYCCSESD